MYPKLTLKADFENGEGSIGNIEKWRGHDPLLRADILQDWIADLTEEYNYAVENLFVKLEKVQEQSKGKSNVTSIRPTGK
jgi:hypothetical protein